ncbi:thiamine-phosphate kinase [Elusimicrobiota bacterium]
MRKSKKRNKPLLKDIGEYKLLTYLKSKINTSCKNPSISLGIGDDAFVGNISKNCSLVSTKDLLIEDIHFNRLWSDPYQIGYKAIAVNLSDLAAMGKCKPLYCLVGLGLPPNTSLEFVDKLYTGMQSISNKHDLSIVGGDTVSTKKSIVISITLLGEIYKKNIISRGCAKPGDIIVVNSTFGDSAAGMYLLRKKTKSTSKINKYLINKHLLPVPRIKDAGIIADAKVATSMIDSSDGLSVSLKFITEESKVGAKVNLEKVPISRQLKNLAQKDKRLKPLELALNGGEDYELLFTIKKGSFKKLKSVLPNAVAIGEITSKKGTRYYLNGHLKRETKQGYQHFR